MSLREGTMTIRRIRRAAGATVVSASDKAKAVELLKSISKATAQVAVLKASLAGYEADLFKHMSDVGMDTVSIGKEATASIEEPVGRAKNTIPPADLRKVLNDDKEFYSCVEVINSRAAEFVPQKVLAKITRSTPGEKKPRQLVVKLAK